MASLKSIKAIFNKERLGNVLNTLVGNAAVKLNDMSDKLWDENKPLYKTMREVADGPFPHAANAIIPAMGAIIASDGDYKLSFTTYCATLLASAAAKTNGTQKQAQILPWVIGGLGVALSSKPEYATLATTLTMVTSYHLMGYMSEMPLTHDTEGWETRNKKGHTAPVSKGPQ